MIVYIFKLSENQSQMLKQTRSKSDSDRGDGRTILIKNCKVADPNCNRTS